MLLFHKWFARLTSPGLSRDPFANERRTVLQDDALAFGSHEKTNGVDVRERDFIEIQRRWSTTRGNLLTHRRDVFGTHAADQTNRGPVFADVGDDPQRHGRDRAIAWRWCNWQSLPRSCAASDLQGGRVLMVQNLLIGQRFGRNCRRRPIKLSGSCTD